MPLPVLNNRGGGTTPTDLLRLFARTQLHWSRHLGEETQLDFGVAIANPAFPGVVHANHVVNVALPEGMTAVEAKAAADAHFGALGVQCLGWFIDPSATPARTQPIVDLLREKGFHEGRHDVMYLQGVPRSISEISSLRIIPARASYRHTLELLQESGVSWNHAPVADASLLHLDDPHTDALIALRDGSPVAYMAVLSVGEVGTIEDVFVTERFRGQGVGRTMMSRALEICARSLFRHVFLHVDPANAAAIHLYQKCGFERIGETSVYFVTPGRET